MIKIAGSQVRSDQLRNSLLEKRTEYNKQKDERQIDGAAEGERRKGIPTKQECSWRLGGINQKTEKERAKTDHEKAKVETLKLQLLPAEPELQLLKK
jgi:hypothetical protein